MSNYLIVIIFVVCTVVLHMSASKRLEVIQHHVTDLTAGARLSVSPGQNSAASTRDLPETAYTSETSKKSGDLRLTNPRKPGSSIVHEYRVPLLTASAFLSVQPNEDKAPLRSSLSASIPSSSLQTREKIKMSSPLTLHALDTSSGHPASGLPLVVYQQTTPDQWRILYQGATNSDGRVTNMITQEQFTSGVYKIFFDTDKYFRKRNVESFYPYVEIVFRIINPNEHYHVPLILSPFGYSTYRGS